MKATSSAMKTGTSPVVPKTYENGERCSMLAANNTTTTASTTRNRSIRHGTGYFSAGRRPLIRKCSDVTAEVCHTPPPGRLAARMTAAYDPARCRSTCWRSAPTPTTPS